MIFMSNNKGFFKLIVPAKIIYVDGLKKPSAPRGGEPRYNCLCLVNKSNARAMNDLKATYAEVEAWGIKNKWNGRKPAAVSFEATFPDAVESKGETDWAQGNLCFSPKSSYIPPVIDGDNEEIAPENYYNGMDCLVCVLVYAYLNDQGGKGISSILRSIKWLGTGEEIEVGTDAAADFKDYEQQDKTDWGAYV